MQRVDVIVAFTQLHEDHNKEFDFGVSAEYRIILDKPARKQPPNRPLRGQMSTARAQNWIPAWARALAQCKAFLR